MSTRRDLIEGHLAKAVAQHEQIREWLRKMDEAGTGMQRLTCEVRGCLTTLATLYNAVKLEMTVDAMVGGGEFTAPTGQQPVSELGLFAAGALPVTDERGARMVGMLPPKPLRDESDRFAQELEHIGDDTLRDEASSEQNVLLEEVRRA